MVLKSVNKYIKDLWFMLLWKYLFLSYHWCLAVMRLFIECLDIHGTHVTVNNFTNSNNVFFFVSDLKIIYYNNY